MSHSHKLQSNRAKKARLARRIPELVVRLLASSLYIFGVAGGLLLVLNEQQAGLIFIGSGFVIYMFVVWYKETSKYCQWTARI